MQCKALVWHTRKKLEGPVPASSMPGTCIFHSFLFYDVGCWPTVHKRRVEPSFKKFNSSIRMCIQSNPCLGLSLYFEPAKLMDLFLPPLQQQTLSERKMATSSLCRSREHIKPIFVVSGSKTIYIEARSTSNWHCSR